MRKTTSIISVSLIAASLLMPITRSYADDDDRGSRQELRQDRQQLQELRDRRNHEIREGDRHEAREYNDRIHDLKRDLHRDRKASRHDEDQRHRGRGDDDHD